MARIQPGCVAVLRVTIRVLAVKSLKFVPTRSTHANCNIIPVLEYEETDAKFSKQKARQREHALNACSPASVLHASGSVALYVWQKRLARGLTAA